ncbi:NUDIX domain-containing protein [Microbacterium sp. zg-Y818]|uniref:NUDIX hydrolase n=1 Tax=unclassified Microbacterium TaxID=2609290 RepID=UPI00214C1CB4|nr:MULTISPECIES: NUDIX domain-containing protein [unclassified Microbacterium]MCR2801651.1 NUDIX domain-containing protein [Microbacterium sp. zg.Y818]WIM23078.1 NUDIX domain-containing protein [Microbacterium sp. zg-Y818]
MPEDAIDPAVPVAGTVVLLRDGDAGLEVLMLERPDRGSFAGAWVFPGGKVDADDRVGPTDSEEDVARAAGVRETREEVGLCIDPAELVTLSVWDPPPALPLRIRTWFFFAPDPGGEVRPAPDEAVAARWLRPADALAAHGRDEMILYPPTWVALHGLLGHDDAGSALAAARLGGIQHFETVAHRGTDGPLLLWQEDAEYEPSGAGGAARHRLEVGALPWRYTRAAG